MDNVGIKVLEDLRKRGWRWSREKEEESLSQKPRVRKERRK
jgi:hypothetical protein